MTQLFFFFTKYLDVFIFASNKSLIILIRVNFQASRCRKKLMTISITRGRRQVLNRTITARAPAVCEAPASFSPTSAAPPASQRAAGTLVARPAAQGTVRAHATQGWGTPATRVPRSSGLWKRSWSGWEIGGGVGGLGRKSHWLCLRAMGTMRQRCHDKTCASPGYELMCTIQYDLLIFAHCLANVGS